MDKLINRLVARHVRKGGNEVESRKLLNDLLAWHTGGNLAYALYYNGFATEAAAVKAAAALSA